MFSGVLPFVAVAQAGSFRRGGERLGVSAAAVSKAVQRLEAEVGVQLLERSTRRVALTPEGEAFLARCAEAVELVRSGREFLDLARREPAGELTIALPHILGRPLLRRLPRFRSRAPSLRLHLRCSDRHVDLVGDEVDVALRIGQLADASHLSRRLLTPRWVCVASPAYLHRHGRPDRPEALHEHACLKFRGTDQRLVEFSFLNDAGQAERFETPTALDIDQGELLLEAAQTGLGICQALDFMVSEQLESGQLVSVLDAWCPAGPPVQAIYRRGRARSARVRAFLDFVAGWSEGADPGSPRVQQPGS